MAAPIKTVIGFDFGSRWTGVAVGQTLTGRATPLRAIKSRDWREIENILREWQPQVLVVGLPLNMFDQQQQMSRQAQRFARQLEGRFGIKTQLVDERLTTREAYRLALENSGKKSKQEIDCLAAALIVESWLVEHGGDSN